MERCENSITSAILESDPFYQFYYYLRRNYEDLFSESERRWLVPLAVSIGVLGFLGLAGARWVHTMEVIALHGLLWSAFFFYSKIRLASYPLPKLSLWPDWAQMARRALLVYLLATPLFVHSLAGKMTYTGILAFFIKNRTAFFSTSWNESEIGPWVYVVAFYLTWMKVVPRL